MLYGLLLNFNRFVEIFVNDVNIVSQRVENRTAFRFGLGGILGTLAGDFENFGIDIPTLFFEMFVD